MGRSEGETLRIYMLTIPSVGSPCSFLPYMVFTTTQALEGYLSSSVAGGVWIWSYYRHLGVNPRISIFPSCVRLNVSCIAGRSLTRGLAIQSVFPKPLYIER